MGDVVRDRLPRSVPLTVAHLIEAPDPLAVAGDRAVDGRPQEFLRPLHGQQLAVERDLLAAGAQVDRLGRGQDLEEHVVRRDPLLHHLRRPEAELRDAPSVAGLDRMGAETPGDRLRGLEWRRPFGQPRLAPVDQGLRLGLDQAIARRAAGGRHAGHRGLPAARGGRGNARVGPSIGNRGGALGRGGGGGTVGRHGTVLRGRGSCRTGRGQGNGPAMIRSERSGTAPGEWQAPSLTPRAAGANPPGTGESH